MIARNEGFVLNKGQYELNKGYNPPNVPYGNRSYSPARAVGKSDFALPTCNVVLKFRLLNESSSSSEPPPPPRPGVARKVIQLETQLPQGEAEVWMTTSQMGH